MSEAELCSVAARKLVHKYAAFGATFAALPIPVATTFGLTALETHLIHTIGRVYGAAPTHADTLMIASGLEITSLGLKTVARELAAFIPVVGWGVKAAIAGSAVEGIGHLAIQFYEGRYPKKRIEIPTPVPPTPR